MTPPTQTPNKQRKLKSRSTPSLILLISLLLLQSSYAQLGQSTFVLSEIAIVFLFNQLESWLSAEVHFYWPWVETERILHLIVVSDRFKAMPLWQRHQLIENHLQKDLQELRNKYVGYIKTWTPYQYRYKTLRSWC